jgi:hypothetical protein
MTQHIVTTETTEKRYDTILVDAVNEIEAKKKAIELIGNRNKDITVFTIGKIKKVD